MNQELLIRLFRSIEGDQKDDIIKVAFSIINDENKRGHTKLAEKLEKILFENISTYSSFKGQLKEVLPQGVAIPTNKRNNSPFFSEIKYDNLRHEMILAENVEIKIQRIEKEFVAKNRLLKFGLKPRQKILLYGPPGCGKSMSAERIAWTIGLPFLKVRFDAIISSYLGESATNLKKLFDSIQEIPCVLLLDEFDFIGKNRESKQDVGEMHRIVNILLNLLEEYSAPGIIIATTNLEESLDKALFRRFDDIIEIPKPSNREIKRLLIRTLSTIEKEGNIDWEKIVSEMQNLSAALVVKIANDAAKIAVISNRNKLTNQDLENSIQENAYYYN